MRTVSIDEGAASTRKSGTPVPVSQANLNAVLRKMLSTTEDPEDAEDHNPVGRVSFLRVLCFLRGGEVYDVKLAERNGVPCGPDSDLVEDPYRNMAGGARGRCCIRSPSCSRPESWAPRGGHR